MDQTLIGQLACRGALELPNDPFAAIAKTSMRDQRKFRLTRAERERAARQAAGYWDWLMREYGK